MKRLLGYGMKRPQATGCVARDQEAGWLRDKEAIRLRDEEAMRHGMKRLLAKG
jgi:hypothetical protein